MRIATRVQEPGPAWAEAAQDLLDASERRARRGVAFDDSENGMHYRAYLRAAVQYNEVQATHLAKKYIGSKKAREDLISDAGRSRPYAVGEGIMVPGWASELEEARLAETKMIGFRPAGRSSVDVVARLEVRWERKGSDYEPSVQVVILKEGQAPQFAWLKKLEAELGKTVISLLKKTGTYPSATEREQPGIGLVEIGAWGVQNAYSDDSYLGVRGDNDVVAKAVAEVIKKLVPVGGGGVPGSSYRGTGLRGSGGEYVYHYHSFGIGD